MFVLSSMAEERLREWGYAGPIIRMTTAFPDQLFANCKSYPIESKFHILFLARLEREKGVYLALDACGILCRKYPGHIRVTMAGSGREEQGLAAYAAQCGVDDISFPGYVTGEAKADLMQIADCYLFTSYHEGMPCSVLEAMGGGLAVITSKVGGLPDFFEPGQMGAMITDFEPEHFADALEKLYLNRNLTEAYGRYNFDFARSHFKASCVAERILQFLETSDKGGHSRHYGMVPSPELLKQLGERLAAEDFRCDSINTVPETRFFAWLQRNRFTGILLRQAFRLSPFNFRGLCTRRPPPYNPKAIALMLYGACLAREILPEESARWRMRLEEILFSMRSSETENFALIQNKVLHMRMYQAGREDVAPLATVLAGYYFLETWQITGKQHYRELACSVATYFVAEHRHLCFSDGLYFNYDNSDDFLIYNASAVIAAFLLRYAKVTGDTSARSMGREAIRFILSRQNADGSWFYGNDPATHYVDNFHTAMVLGALDEALAAGCDEVLPALQKGFDYYCRTLDVPGRPRRFDKRWIPRNAMAFQRLDLRDLLLTAFCDCRAAEADPARFRNAEYHIQYALDHMFRRGIFACEKTLFWTNHIFYIDFQAWGFLALAAYLNRKNLTGKN